MNQILFYTKYTAKDSQIAMQKQIQRKFRLQSRVNRPLLKRQIGVIDSFYSYSSFSFPFFSLVNATEGPLAYFVTTDHNRACGRHFQRPGYPSSP